MKQKIFEFIENKEKLMPNTKKTYKTAINTYYKQFQELSLENIKTLKHSIQYKILCVLTAFEPSNKDYTNYFTILKEIRTNQEPKEIPNFNIDEIHNKIKDIKEPVFKLLYTLISHYPVLRAGDYHSLSVKSRKKCHNYIQMNGKIVFNQCVKIPITKPIIIQLSKEHTKLFKNVLKELRKSQDKLFTLTMENFIYHTTQINKKIGLPSGISLFRKLMPSNLGISKEFKEEYTKINNLAKTQNHTASTMIKYYL